MSQPETATTEKKNTSLLIRGAIWIAIGALIAAALVCVVWVLVGDQDGLIGRAFLTILLFAGFAGIAILEASLAPKRPDWLALASMVSWIIALIVGAFKIWLPDDDYYFSGAERFLQLLLVVGILQLALLHVRLFTPAAHRHPTTFNRVIYIVTVVFLGALVAMLVFFLTFPETFDYVDLYWRIVVALTILAAVGTTLVPLLNALFAPKKPAAPTAKPGAFVSWPTFADGISPLPALPDGTPDWNAYYTGYPSAAQPQAALAAPVASYPTDPAGQFPVAPAPQAASPAQPAPPVPSPPTHPAPSQPAPPSPAAQPAQPAPPVPPVPPLPSPAAPPSTDAFPPAPPAPRPPQ
ncbi:hypothetical protein [Microbacterium sp. 179-I 3D4 NHS]|uniref:hypothetical protein n=1 Tax=Microbacterium sp. 179-I 3D4 NHS TaxID=3142381 RepID=UPI0039A01F88